jgi:D-alanyl-D-alanine carboxypeptidase
LKQKIRRLLCCLLAACYLFAITASAEPPSWPSDTGILAESGVVIDADSGALLFGQNCIDTAYPPASITKLLTALIVLENCKLDDIVTFSETAMNSVEADSGNKLSLVAGDQMTVEDCLYSLLLFSINQSANALAEHTAGSIPAFVDMMNAKAAELGCSDKTHFENPSGLNGNTQNVTAYDMALIAQAAFDNEELVKISSALSHKINSTINNPDGISFRQEHRLLYTDDPNSEFYYPPAIAGKTGYLKVAGNTLVTYAEQDGRRLISVILKGSRPQYFVDGKTLLEFGFARFQNVSIADHETRYITGDETLELNGFAYRATDLMIEPEKVITLPKNASFEDAVLTLEPLPDGAPVNAVAVLRYTYNDRFIGKAYLLAKEADVNLVLPSDSNLADSGDGQNAGGSGKSGGFPFLPIHLSSAMVTAIAVTSILAVLMASVIAWILYSRRKEAKELAARREARRRRLQAYGDEKEFQRLLEMRKSKNTSSHED